MIKPRKLFRSSFYRIFCVLITIVFLFGLLPAPVLAETPEPTSETSASFAKWIPLIIGLVVVLGLGSFIMVRRRG